MMLQSLKLGLDPSEIARPGAGEMVGPTSRPDPAADRSAMFSRAQRCALLFAFALIVAFRLPHAWAHGRFQDEEATVFFAYAWHFPWHDALFRSFAGYLNLTGNGIGLFAARVVRAGKLPLEYAPYLTMVISLGFQLLPAILILTGKAEWLARRSVALAALLIVAIAPATEEVFFNAANVQFHLALSVALILSLDVPATRAGRVSYGVLLFLAPLCGPGSIVLIPLFALRAFLDKDIERVKQLSLLAAAAALQLLVFYSASPLRHALDLRTVFAALFVRLFLLPVVGLDLTNWIALNLAGSPALPSAAAAAAIGLFGILIVGAWRRRAAIVWLVLAALLIATISTRFGIFSFDRRNMFDVTIGERYEFVPLVLLSLAAIAMAGQDAFRGRLVWVVIAVVILINAAFDYRKASPQWADGPNWAAEVHRWKEDATYAMSAWPQRWRVDLSPRSGNCSPVTADFRHSNEPRYCESGWLASFYSQPKPNPRRTTP